VCGGPAEPWDALIGEGAMQRRGGVEDPARLGAREAALVAQERRAEVAHDHPPPVAVGHDVDDAVVDLVRDAVHHTVEEQRGRTPVIGVERRVARVGGPERLRDTAFHGGAQGVEHAHGSTSALSASQVRASSSALAVSSRPRRWVMNGPGSILPDATSASAARMSAGPAE
jgi:hypothetical protein